MEISPPFRDRLVGLSFVLAVLAPTSVHAEEGDAYVSSVARTHSETGHREWAVDFVVPLGTEIPSDIRAMSSVTGLEELRVESSRWQTQRELRVSIPEQNYARYYVVRVFWGQNQDIGGATFYLEPVQDTLREMSYDEVSRRLDELDPPQLGPEYPEEFRTLSPLENPRLPDADRAHARAAMEQGDDVVAIATGALSSGPSTDSEARETGDGCMASHSVNVWLLAIAGLAGFTRRGRRTRLLGLSVALSCVAGSETAQARTAYGYVVFWDARSVGSDDVGSRKPWCDVTLTNCVAGSADCCFRPLDTALITVRQGGADLATGFLSSTGYYSLTFVGDDTQDYDFRITFERPGTVGLPGALRIVYSSPAVTATNTVKINLPPSQQNYWVPDIRLNAAQDTTSPVGDRATMWKAATEVQRALIAEGDTRYRRLFGEPSTDPDDLITIDTDNSYTGSDCNSSLLSVQDAYARGSFTEVQMANIYRGRVVGCDSTYYTIAGGATVSGPAFPKTPRSQGWGSADRTAEGVALGAGIDLMVFALTLWDPSTTDYLSMDDNTSWSSCHLNLNGPGNQNSNDSTYPLNAMRGLWEWIDSPTAQYGIGVDNSDITVKLLMDGLLYLKNRTGSGDGYGGEAVFTPSATSCTSNESCPSGDACVYQGAGSVTLYCASGDPHGSNLEDLAGALKLIAAPGRGALLTSLRSTQCITASDNTYPYDGGYRTD